MPSPTTVILLTIAVVTAQNPAAEQIILFKMNTSGPIGIMTTSAGAPIDYQEATDTLHSNLIFNEYFMDSLTHLVRERIPARIVHPKAAGAFGYFEVTHDITHICKAKLFSAVGKKTPVAVRFSPANTEKGGSDTNREARGFAIKFYTEEGNFDIPGFNTPIFAVKDPSLFHSFVRIARNNPVTNLPDPNAFWDLATLRPESLFIFMYVFSDRGIPDGYRYMPGFGIHTYQVVNAQGEIYFVRFHFYPDAGIKNLNSTQASQISAEDPDYAIRDLYNAIGNEDFPSWTVSIQILSLADVKNAKFDVFDVTKLLPIDTYPLTPLGRFVLDRNPINHFAELEQLAFCPANLVPGILGGPDKLYEARRLSYRDAAYYRLGANFNKILVNIPRHEALTYNRDGSPPVRDNGRDSPNYYPNSFNGPVPYEDKHHAKLITIHQDDSDNFEQAREFYATEMSKEERQRLVENLVASLSSVLKFLQDRAVKIFTIIHPELGERIFQGLQGNGTEYQCED